jgi:hypothetical protein
LVPRSIPESTVLAVVVVTITFEIEVAQVLPAKPVLQLHTPPDDGHVPWEATQTRLAAQFSLTEGLVEVGQNESPTFEVVEVVR